MTITRKIERKYEYRHPLGSVVTDAEVGLSAKGRRSLAAEEINRLSRMVALQFLAENYRKSIEDDDFSLSAREVRSIMALMGVNQSEFGKLVGCQKSKISKILRDEQRISKSQAQLAIERLAMELALPGSTSRLLGNRKEPLCRNENAMHAVDELRYGT